MADKRNYNDRGGHAKPDGLPVVDSGPDDSSDDSKAIESLLSSPESDEGGSDSPPQAKVPIPTGQEPIEIGSGVIDSLIASGSMSRVYKIWNSILEEYRAVKLLLPTEREELRNRFLTEAKITGKLRHPNIIDIYSVGEWNGLPFIEMELVEGDSLDSLIKRTGRIPPNVSISVAVAVARALAFAHEKKVTLYGKEYRGVIHRDLKPANIILSSDGKVKLTDFGVARPAEAGLHNTVAGGTVVGTLQYFSPEQMDARELDARTDIYSFGAVLYEMLTGSSPFPQKSITTLIRMKTINSYRLLSDYDIELNTALRRIVDRCLQIDPANRYQNGRQLLEALEDVRKQASPHDSTDTITKKFVLSHADEEELDKLGDVLDGTQSRKRKRARAFLIGGIVSAVLAFTALAGLIVLNTPAFRHFVARNVTKPQPKSDLEKRLQEAAVSMDKHHYLAAIEILENLWEKHPLNEEIILRLLNSYVAVWETEKAWDLVQNHPVYDGGFDLMAGYLQHKKGNTEKALDLFESATMKPCIARDKKRVERDAYYFRAMITNKIHKEQNTPQSRRQAIEAWEKVKRAYESVPKHPRFRRADAMLSSLLELFE